MDVARAARGQAINRVAIGAGLMLAPALYARPWIGVHAKDERAKVLARSMGARDLALGAAGLLALRAGDRQWLRRSFAAQAFADAVDFLAIVVVGRDVPVGAKLLGGTMAASSAAVAAEYARRGG
jgi:hypothetical protein